MIPLDKVTVLLLASGLSHRFGQGNKLVEPLAGKPLVAHVAGLARSLSFGARIAVVPAGDPAFRDFLQDFGFETIANPRPEEGRESSLRLGLAHALEAGAEAILVLLADMPHLDAAHIRALAAAASLDRPAVSAKGDRGMPPLIIPAGIARIALATPDLPIRAVLSDAVRLATPEAMLRDYDTRADFELARLSAIPGYARSPTAHGRDRTEQRMKVETRGEKMQQLRRDRMAAAPAFLRGGYRPFFFGASAWAVIALCLWLATFFHGYSLPTAMDALAWHRHEMLFGFVGAVVAGFLLTAIPNWTGRLPIAGPPLFLLFALWMAGRAALLFSAATGLAFAALLDVGFYLALAALAGREVLAAKNRNLPIVGLVLLFGLANGADHAATMGRIADPMLGIRAGIALVLLMITLIGGRIIPSFTRNWLAKHKVTKGLPSQPGRFDLAAIALTAAALIAWTAAPEGGVTGAVLLLAGLAQFARLSRWSGLRAARDPLVLILHIGFAWLPVGLLLLGGSILLPSIAPSAAIHALTGGAMATMILAVMTRATLGHSGRELRAGGPTILIYALVTLGAVLRVAASLLLVPYAGALAVAGLAWGGAFLLFLFVYGPILFRLRQGEAG